MDDYLVRTADEIRVSRAHAGADLCRAAIADVLAARRAATVVPAEELSPADVIVQRARLRAAAERRARPIDGWRAA